MNTSRTQVTLFPFLAQFAALMTAAVIGTYALHLFDVFWFGRFLGIPGTLLILLSLFYSLRKRNVIKRGDPQRLLGLHEITSLIGAAMVLVHAGTHLNAVLPWMALVAMMINAVSGLTGAYLLARSRRRLRALRERTGTHGLPKDEAEREQFSEAVAFELMEKWRVVHYPISIIFAVLAVGHIVSVLLFWEWR